jgi:hypothetical protein
MFIQTVIQTLLRKRKRSEKAPKLTAEKELSPMAQRIMQKLAEHEKKNEQPGQKSLLTEGKD